MGLKDKLIAKLLDVLRGLADKYLDFIKKPEGFLSVSLAVKALLSSAMKGIRAEIEKYISQTLTDGTNPLLSNLFDRDKPVDSQAFDDAVSQYVKRSPELRALNAYLDRDFNFEVASEIVLACGDPDSEDRIDTVLRRLSSLPSSGLNGEDLINTIRETSDFDQTIAGLLEGLRNRWEGSAAQEIVAKISGYLPYLFLVYDLFRKTREWLDQNERPSKWFAKLLSARLRRIASIIGNFADRTVTEYEGKAADSLNSIKGLIDGIRAVDVGIAAMTLATAIYEDNVRKLQAAAGDWIKGWFQSEACDTQIEDPSTGNTALSASSALSGISPLALSDRDLIAAAVSCENQRDTNPSPRKALSNSSAADVLCEVQKTSSIPSPPDIPLLAPQPPIATTAVYSYLGDSTWSPIAKQGQDLKPEDPLFEISYPDDPQRPPRIIRSSIIGKVRTIDIPSTQIVIEDYIVPEDRPLERDLQDLNSLYQELSNNRRYLKQWAIRLLYPPMLSRSPLVDSSLAASADLEIRYKSSVERRWEGARQAQSGRKFDGNGGIDKGYDKDIKRLTDVDSVQKASENEETQALKDRIDSRTEKYYRDLRKIFDTAIEEAQHTKGKSDEVTLYDWYVEVLQELTATRTSQYDLDYEINTPTEDKEPISNAALDWTIRTVSEFLSERAFIDGYNPEEVQEKIETYAQDLDGRDYFVTEGIDPSGGYYGILNGVYEYARSEGKNGKQALRVTPSTIDLWGKGKNAPDPDAASSLRFRIYTLFSFLKTVADKELQEYQTSETSSEATAREGAILLSKLSELWKSLQEIPKEIDEIVKKLDDQSDSYVPESQGEYVAPEYRDLPLPQQRLKAETVTYFYTNDIPVDCPVTSDSGDGDLSSLKYWLRYCAFATLGSCTSPLSWATGLPPPIGPVPLPTIYIPVKGFSLAWGVVLIGITVTGIYPFPFLMVGNLSASPVVPFADPATAIRREAQALKKGLLRELDDLKTITLEPAIEKAQEEVVEIDQKIATVEEDIRELREQKPRRDRRAEAFGDKAAALSAYSISLASWNRELVTARAAKAELGVERFAKALKAKVLSDKSNDIATASIVDPLIQTIEYTEGIIDKAFDALLAVLDGIDPLIGALPISVKAMSASFAFTLKRPTPWNTIADGFDDVVKADPLQPFLDAIDLNRDDLMGTGFSTLWSIKTAALDTAVGLYTSPASPLRTLLVPVEPFPTYEALTPLNISWWGIPATPVSPIGFIQPSWVTAGGKSYGIPGFK